jgi:hypothetical protein
MNLNEFILKWTNKICDYDNFYGGQCVDIYRMYVKEVLGFPQSPGVVGAKDIWNSYLSSHFDRIPNTPTGIPSAGDIMIWGSSYGPYGHVAVVTAATLNTFTCFSQNDPVGALCGLKTYKTYLPTLGWLHPKENMTADEMIIKKVDFERLVTKATRLDEIFAKYNVTDTESLYRVIGGYVSRATDLSNQLGKLQAEVVNREEQVTRLKEQIANLTDDVNSLTSSLNVKIAEYEDLAIAKGKQYIELQQALTALDTLKQAQVQGEVTLTLGELFKLLWNQKLTIKR